MNTLKIVLDHYRFHGAAAAWCQGTEARDAWGQPAGEWDSDATQWCLHGAITRAASARYLSAILQARRRVKRCEFDTIGGWNDIPGRTYEDVETFLSMDDVVE